MPEKVSNSAIHDTAVDPDSSTIDLLSYHEHNAGRLVVDPE